MSKKEQEYNDESLRIMENLAVLYDNWLENDANQVDYRLGWKNINGHDYLYQQRGHAGNGTSLGPRSEETEATYNDYRAKKDAWILESEALNPKAAVIFQIYRAMHLPMISKQAGEVLRAADECGLLGSALLVVGTNTMAAYEMEAHSRFATGMDATEDCDLVWAAENKTALALKDAKPILHMLKKVDSSYVVNTEKTFQARNAGAYEVEIMAAPSSIGNYPIKESLRPVVMPEQEWLLKGRHVEQILFDRGGKPVKIVAPDPRWMALHKLWLADKPERNPRKINKDRKQGIALLKAIQNSMPHYPMNAEFIEEIPEELQKYKHFVLDAISHGKSSSENESFDEPKVKFSGVKNRVRNV